MRKRNLHVPLAEIIRQRNLKKPRYKKGRGVPLSSLPVDIISMIFEKAKNFQGNFSALIDKKGMAKDTEEDKP